MQHVCVKENACYARFRPLFGDLVSYSLISETLPAPNKGEHSALLRLHFQQPGRE